MKARERQVGGNHYAAAVQHWDYCIEAGVPYLEAAASKYITRYKKKNGVQDVEKAIHYIEKRMESFFAFKGIIQSVRKRKGLFDRFIESNEIDPKVAEMLDRIMHWRSPSMLQDALNDLKDFHQVLLESEEGAPTSAYVNQDR